MTGAAAGEWFRRYEARPGAGTELFVFPHGGGAASFYRRLARALPDDVDVLVVQYPGREDRLGEPCHEDMASLAEAVTAAVARSVTRRFAFLGHSMGASVAFEVAYRLWHRFGLRPVPLVVSGRPGPRYQERGTKHLDDEALWSELTRLSGTAGELVASADVRKLVLPRLRADYRLIESYVPVAGRTVPFPVLALTGRDDPEAGREEMLAWRETTTEEFGLAEFDGGHFYFRGREPEVAARLARALTTRGVAIG